MVQAILEGRKTMTRRIVNTTMHGWDAQKMQFTIVENHKSETIGCQAYFKDKENHFHLGIKCPYGQPGDVLWVRETHQFRYNDISQPAYKADFPDSLKNQCNRVSWKPSIHMPKAACRIFIQVTSIRVERLQDITKKDSIAEGILSDHTDGDYYYFYPCNDLRDDTYLDNPITSFYSLWKSINSEESWNSNPWVWVIEFKRIDKPENF